MTDEITYVRHVLNCTTGEDELVPMTDEEIAAFESVQVTKDEG